MSSRVVLFFLVACATVVAGPPDFGQQELRTAMAERKVSVSVDTELNLDQPETFHITPVGSTSYRVSGGDLRGLMYGLIDVADQIRGSGTITKKAADPGFSTRSVRVAPSDAELAAPGFYTSDRWIKIFGMLARNRMNRITLVLPVESIEYGQLRFLSQQARDHGVDFDLGIRGPLGARPLLPQLRKVLDECVLIRGIQVEVGREPVDYFRSTIFPAVQQTGRRVTLDLRGLEARADILRAGQVAGVVFNIAGKNSSSALDAPFYGIVTEASTEPADVQSKLTALATAGARGFEIDLMGSNLENYERTYWAWGRAGYDHHAPTLTPGKPTPPPPASPTKPAAKAPTKSTRKK